MRSTLVTAAWGWHPPVLATIHPADWLARLRPLSPTVETHPLDPWGDTMFMLRKHTTAYPP